ncbi:MAG: tetratricopeptide repeat protein [Cytophagales bacterium]|nr:tetratricopeptide repeat protein [Armatimonadota bacterium]
MRKKPVGYSVLATLPLLLLASALMFWVVTALSLRSGSGALRASASEEAARVVVGDIVTDLGKGRTQQADALFSRWVSGNGSTAYVLLASEITRKGHPSDAARYLIPATQNQDMNWDPMLWATLAEAQNKANDSEQARKSEAEADRRAEAFLQTLGQKAPSGSAAVLDRIGRLRQVASYYNSPREKRPDHAISLLEEALRLNRNALTLNDLGYTLADKGRTSEEFDRAVGLTKDAVELAPGNPIVLDSYGWALFKKNDLAGARRVLREAVDAEPSIAEMHYHLGVVYGQLGLIREAHLELGRALLLDPDSAEAREAKKRLRQPPGQGVVEKA